jgi:single-stranded-DNA-specific exonuclease
MSDSLLKIDHSLMSWRWQSPDIRMDDIERISRTFALPEIVSRMILGRGISEDQISQFLNPTLKDHLPSPLLMAGMKEMAENMARAIASGKQIAIFSDFDVDGATSAAILFRFLKGCGIDAPIYIPDRLSEGYGPNLMALQTLKDQGADIVFMLDCGTTAFEIVQQGQNIGLEIVIFDHHEAEDVLPNASHIINPKRKDDTSGLSMLAACGVTFMACIAINAALRDLRFFEQKKIPEPSIKNLLDLVALGTICDMVPLTHINRLLVRAGLSRIPQSDNIGLKALMQVSGLKPPISTYHAGFALGPRINAGSRVHKADLGAKLLSTDDPEEALNIAWLLNDCNDKRKDIQAQMEREAFAKIEAQGLDQNPVIIVEDPSWHPGLSGLVAGRIKDKFGKPACVITYAANLDGRLEGRGSGRSVAGLDIAAAFIAARHKDIIIKGGGHAMAGGFTIEPEKIDNFRNFMNEFIAARLSSSDHLPTLSIDGVLTVKGVNTELALMLERSIGPFGQAHPEPVFVLSNIRIHSADVRGENHIALQISDWEGGARIKAMAFKTVGTRLGDALLKDSRQAFHLVGTIKINEWQGRQSAEMHIIDGAYALENHQSIPKIAQR